MPKKLAKKKNIFWNNSEIMSMFNHSRNRYFLILASLRI